MRRDGIEQRGVPLQRLVGIGVPGLFEDGSRPERLHQEEGRLVLVVGLQADPGRHEVEIALGLGPQDGVVAVPVQLSPALAGDGVALLVSVTH